jgi:hypothetical protein
MTVQRMAALERAIEVRTWRGEQRRRIEGGDVQWACELLLAKHDLMGGKTPVTVRQFLQWLPGINDPYRSKKAAKIVDSTFHWPSEKTFDRHMDKLDLQTAMRFAAAIKAQYGIVEELAA